MNGLRIYLLAGLLTHKFVWEILKRRDRLPYGSRERKPLRVRLVKAVKVAILLGIVAQTFLPEVLPIAADPPGLVWAGTAIFTAGLAVALAGRLQLGRNWSDIEAGSVRRGHAVVDTGIYRYIRHPIYVGDLALLLGLEMALNSWLVLGVVLLAPVVLRQAVREERKLAGMLPGYAEYCRRTGRFVPSPFRKAERAAV
jgi:protein-S-isoprenylcysteine O-methyltransferase Ste14